MVAQQFITGRKKTGCIDSGSGFMALFGKKNLTNRILEIDVIRGACILLMVFDHAMFDMFGLFPNIFSNYPGANTFVNWLYDASYNYWLWDVRIVVQEIVIFVFFALTGVCCSFSRSNLKRGGLLFLVALGVSVVTHVVSFVIGDMNNAVIFGVLHCMSLSLLIVGCLEKAGTDKYVYLVAGIICVTVGIFIHTKQVRVSYDEYSFFKALWLSVIGLIEVGGDTMPLILYGGETFIGVFIGKAFYADKKSLFKRGYSNNPLTFAGRNSLSIYVLHQLIIPIVFGVIFLIMGYKIGL
ncbi:MAG: heparan-alpha-glucosaminide N-acetyltransferase domain-containing protein [Christensenellaceae bacterium]